MLKDLTTTEAASAIVSLTSLSPHLLLLKSFVSVLCPHVCCKTFPAVEPKPIDSCLRAPPYPP